MVDWWLCLQGKTVLMMHRPCAFANMVLLPLSAACFQDHEDLLHLAHSATSSSEVPYHNGKPVGICLALSKNATSPCHFGQWVHMLLRVDLCMYSMTREAQPDNVTGQPLYV